MPQNFRFRMKGSGVPVISSAEMNRFAEDLVRRLMPELFEGQLNYINLTTLFQSLDGWHYTGKYISMDGRLYGAAVFHGGKHLITDEYRRTTGYMEIPDRTILIDRALYQKEYEPVFRFTMAHEIGHAYLHGTFADRRENMQAYADQGKQRLLEDAEAQFGVRDHRTLKSDHDWVEWQANAFASAVLMPESLVREVAACMDDDRGIAGTTLRADCTTPLTDGTDPRVNCTTPLTDGTTLRAEPADPYALTRCNELLLMVSDIFRVSRTAAWFRLKELNLVPEGSTFKRGVIIPDAGRDFTK